MDLSSIFQFCSLTAARRINEKRKRRAAMCRRRLAPEGLEPRLLLSTDPVADNEHYQTYAGGTFVVGVDKGLLSGDAAVGGETVAATAVSQPEHGKLTVNPDGSFTYVPDNAFQGHDEFSYRLVEGATLSNWAKVSLDVLPRSASPKPHTGKNGGGVSPFDSSVPSPEDGAVLSVGNAEAQAGATLDFNISLTNVPQGEGTQSIEIYTADGTAYSPGDYQGIPSVGANYYVDGNANFVVGVQTSNNGPRGDGVTQITMGLAVNRLGPYPDPEAGGRGTIDLSPSPEDCNCSCGCGNVEAQPDPRDGRPIVNSGQGNAPQDIMFHGADEPHPIITVPAVLSATVASSDDVMAQTVIDDLSGNVIGTAPAVYYSPAGYAQGQQAQFSQQLDAGGLSDGTYQYTTSVTEDYTTSGQPAVVNTYSGFFSVDNLDNSPYGRGWSLHNVDRLVVQSGGATVLAGSGNLLFFQQSQQQGGMGGGPTFATPISEWGNMNLAQKSDGSYTLTFHDQSQEIFTAAGLLSTAVDKNGNQTSYQWNSDGTLASTTNQAGETTNFAYTGGLLASVTDFSGRVTDYGYTGSQLTSIATPAPGDGEQQHVTTMTYDPTSGMLSTISDAGGTTTLHYNDFRQVTSITNPDGTSTGYAAPSSASLVDTSTGVGTQSNPAALVYTANVTGSTTDGNGHTSTYSVDPSTGETLSTTDATGTDTTTYEYSDIGQVTQITQPPITSGGANLVTTLGYL